MSDPSRKVHIEKRVQEKHLDSTSLDIGDQVNIFAMCRPNAGYTHPSEKIPGVFLSVLPNNDVTAEQLGIDCTDLRRWPNLSEVTGELRQLSRIAGPLVFTGLLLYARGIISMLFLGYLGELELAGGALAIGFANITGYSVLSGLAMGMEPICGQAYGAKQWKVLGLTMQRTIMILLCASVPIGAVWINLKRILLWCGQDEAITAMASSYILFSIPDLLALSVLHPLKIFFRAQNVTLPLSWSASLALLLHIPVNLFLVNFWQMGIRGVAFAAVWTNINIVIFLVLYLWFSGTYKRYLEGWSTACLMEWKPLLSLAIPSCVSVCLEWWWYEFMIILSGLLVNAKATVAAMGILIQITALVYIFPSSLSLAVSTRVSNELGANRPAMARFAMLVGSGCGIVLGILAMTFTTSIRHKWGRMFTIDKEILHLTAAAMPIVGLCELGNSPQTTGCGVLRGSARPSIGANINLASFYIIGMPVAVILVFLSDIGFVGLWLGLLAAQATCAISMVFVMAHTNWLRQAERSRELTGASKQGNDEYTESTDDHSSKSKGMEEGMIILDGSFSKALSISSSSSSAGDGGGEDAQAREHLIRM